MDLDHDGRVTKQEYLRMNSFRAGEDIALAAFEAMDTNRNGAVRL